MDSTSKSTLIIYIFRNYSPVDCKEAASDSGHSLPPKGHTVLLHVNDPTQNVETINCSDRTVACVPLTSPLCSVGELHNNPSGPGQSPSDTREVELTLSVLR